MFQQIRYFQSVIRLNSFSEAAAECHISQSAVSQQVQALERELGVKLLERKNRKFTLTPAGEHFYKKSLVLLADWERLCMETKAIARQEATQLSMGHLKSYGGRELHRAVTDFSALHPEVGLHIASGNHEDLFHLLISGQADLVFTDQRRAFADGYHNQILSVVPCFIEISSRSPMANLEAIEPHELKNTPCILVASQEQLESEAAYYRDIVGFSGEFLPAENLEEARLMVVGGRGFLPVEGGGVPALYKPSIRRVPLYKGESPMTRNYCVFWREGNPNPYVEEFAEVLKSKFE